jgi:predicted transcriptional regulator YdeE
MPKYRTRPVEIEAFKWNPANLVEAGFVVGVLLSRGVNFQHLSGIGSSTTLDIITGYDVITVHPGEYLVFNQYNYPFACNAETFERTHDRILDENNTRDGD